MHKLHLKLWFVLFIGGLLFVGMLPIWVQAAPPPLPTRPIPTDTPTPTPMPTATPTATLTPIAEPSQSSSIVLEAQSTTPLEWDRLWTVIEWQDGDGAWQPVEGWQGPFDAVDAARGHKTWSIPPTLFGRGPFRWRVDTARNGLTLATSQSFTLPERAGVRLTIELTLPAAPSQPVLLPMTGSSLGWLAAVILMASLLCLWWLPKSSKHR